MPVSTTTVSNRLEYQIVRILRYGFAGLLLVTGIAKLFSFRETLEVLVNFTWIPEPGMVLIAIGLPVFEITLGLLLLFRWKVSRVLALTLILFGLFTAVSIYGTLYHIPGDCGCFGDLAASSFGWGMVARNLLFLAGIGYLWWHKELMIDTRE